MPMLNMRIVFPEHVIDLGRIVGLSGIREESGDIVIGAMTRQREIERSPLIQERLPLLAEAITHVGHKQTRNRGTIGGSLCHLDPSAEQPTIATTMDARLLIAGPGGNRELPMKEFVVDLMTTALAHNEILSEIRLKPWRSGHGWAFLEFARRRGDFAIASTAALIDLDGAGRATRVSIGLGGVAATPCRVPAAEKRLLGTCVSSDDLEAAARLCADVEARGDPHAPSWYRKRLAKTLSSRALRLALERADRGEK